jgi:hypothetical protein
MYPHTPGVTLVPLKLSLSCNGSFAALAADDADTTTAVTAISAAVNNLIRWAIGLLLSTGDEVLAG